MTFQSSSYFNPLQYLHKFECDMGNGATTTSTGTGAAGGTQVYAGFLEIARVETGTTATGAAETHYGRLQIGDGEIWLKQGTRILNLSIVSEEYIAEVGINDGTATVTPTDGCFFRYDRLTSVN